MLNKIKLILVLTIFLVASFLNVAPTQAAGASLYLYPSTGTKVLGSTFSVSVLVNSGGESINTVDGTISYDSSRLGVASVSTGGSVVNLWVAQPKDSGSAVSFSGGILPPGYSGTNGKIITITFKAKSVGDAQVRFSGGAVLANDGKGTNVLVSMGSASFNVAAKVEAPKTDTSKPKTSTPVEKKEPVKARLKPVVTSLTHPNQDEWYQSDSPQFQWELPPGVSGVSAILDNDEYSDPGPKSDGEFSEKTYEDLEDGIWYLHIKFKDSNGWGTIAHYKVQIDNTPPEEFEIRVEQDDENDWPVLHFKTIDELSRILSYEINISSLEENDYKLDADTPFLKTENYSAGEHIVMIRALDKAGNERYVKGVFYIKPIASPIILNYPAEVEPDDKFFVSGTAVPESILTLYIKKNNSLITKEVSVDQGGKWFYINEEELSNGRYLIWAKAVNKNGLSSEESDKLSFLVTPPVFAYVGDFVINYFTVFVSLIFLILLIIILVLLIVALLRKKLKKETYEVEDVLRDNLNNLQKTIDEEISSLGKKKTVAERKIEKEQIKERLKNKLELTKSNILKEVRDVEKILK